MRERTEADIYWRNNSTLFNWSIGIIIASIVLMFIDHKLFPCMILPLILGIICTYAFIKSAPKEELDE